MAALDKDRPVRFQIITRARRKLAANVKAYKGGAAVYVRDGGASNGCVAPATNDPSLFTTGRFLETVDNTGGAAGAAEVLVDFQRQIQVLWLDNDSGGTPVDAADIGGTCYWLDDHTVTADATGASVAGQVYDVVGNFVLVELQNQIALADASDVMITDGAAKFSSGDVEGALQECMTTDEAALLPQVASLTFGHADLDEADGSQTLTFASALPAGAVVIGSGINVTAAFDNVGDSASLTADVGINGGNTDAFIDGASLDAIAKVGDPAGTGIGTLVGAITPCVVVDADVDVDTITKGSATAYVIYVEAF